MAVAVPVGELDDAPFDEVAPAGGAGGVRAVESDGVTELDGAEGSLMPTPLVATTVKVYAVPLVRPVTVMGLPLPVPVMSPGELVTV